MYNLERQLWYLHLLTRHCPCNLLPEPSSPKHEYRGKLWDHLVTSSMTSSPWKNFFWHNLGLSFHIWGKIEAVFNISKFSKWLPFWARDIFFLPEVILEVEYTRNIAMSISDILSFWLTLKLKYWRRYINFNIWPILWPSDVINDVMNIYLYNCSHNLMIPMHRTFNDDIYARFLVIMKNAVISFINENRGPTLRPPCDVIDDVIVMKILFWHNLGWCFQIWGQIEAVFNISKFSKWPPFWARDKLFLPEVIPEVEYARKIAMSISDILSFWSTL